VFIEVLPKNLPAHLEKLSRSGLLQPFYLAGGTGAALQLGHRISIDLDFFAIELFDPGQLAAHLAREGRLSRVEISPGTLHGMFEETRLTFLHYPYPLIQPPMDALGIRIAGLIDIGCMKIDAIAGRGSRKDFVDLYILCQRVISLPQIFHEFEQKYQGIEFNKVHLLKSLCYFEDAEQEPALQLLVPLDWEEVKQFFISESRKIAARWL
jgi:hypothetical protein